MNATALLLANLAGEQLAEPRHLSFQAGRRKRAWDKNVVAIGLSSGFLEPLESTSIHLIQTGIAKLLALFPDTRFAEIERDEYNRLVKAAYDGVRDFIILHYHATCRDDSPFWDHVRTMAVPDSLSRKLELFRAKGRVFRYDDELFTVTSWVAVMLGQGILPTGHDPIADSIDRPGIRYGAWDRWLAISGTWSRRCRPRQRTSLHIVERHEGERMQSLKIYQSLWAMERRHTDGHRTFARRKPQDDRRCRLRRGQRPLRRSDRDRAACSRRARSRARNRGTVLSRNDRRSEACGRECRPQRSPPRRHAARLSAAPLRRRRPGHGGLAAHHRRLSHPGSMSKRTETG